MDHRRQHRWLFDWTETRPGGHSPTRQAAEARLIETLSAVEREVEIAYALRASSYALDVPVNSLKPPD